VKSSDIASLRLLNQNLSRPDFKNPHDVVSHLGAVQAQDYAAAKWSLGLRIQNATDREVEQAFNDGSILRTHVMRPTWHFITPEDILWMLELTSPRVKALLAHYDRKLELDAKLLSRCYRIITKALRDGNNLTRAELAENLEQNKIAARGQRLGHIVSHVELEALICSGPRRGKQFTYALLEKRVPKVKKIRRDEALARLTLKYFTSHGPAQLKDFTWWSGLSTSDAKEGLEMVKSHLVKASLDDKFYWFPPNAKIVQQKYQAAFLLSIFDEYTIAYKDRSALGGERYVEKLLAMGNALTAVIILDGAIVGTWKRNLKKDKIVVIFNLFRKLSRTEENALSEAAKRYGLFLDMPVILS